MGQQRPRATLLVQSSPVQTSACALAHPPRPQPPWIGRSVRPVLIAWPPPLAKLPTTTTTPDPDPATDHPDPPRRPSARPSALQAALLLLGHRASDADADAGRGGGVWPHAAAAAPGADAAGDVRRHCRHQHVFPAHPLPGRYAPLTGRVGRGGEGPAALGLQGCRVSVRSTGHDYSLPRCQHHAACAVVPA